MPVDAATMARDECANFVSDGCLWCRGCLAADGKRCKYFEEVVLPVADWWPDKYALTRQRYWAKHGSGRTRRAIRVCECGAPLAKGKRFCPTCLRRRQRDQARNRKRKSRCHANSKNAVS